MLYIKKVKQHKKVLTYPEPTQFGDTQAKHCVAQKIGFPAPSESSLPVTIWWDTYLLLCQLLIPTKRITFLNYVNDLACTIFTIFK